MNTVAAVLLLSCLGLLSGDSTAPNDDIETLDEAIAENEVDTNYYCGRRLAEALDEVCHGRFNKRSETRLNRLPPVWPRISRTAAYSLGFRIKRGVVAECCDKPCSVDEMVTYCG